MATAGETIVLTKAENTLLLTADDLVGSFAGSADRKNHFKARPLTSLLHRCRAFLLCRRLHDLHGFFIGAAPFCFFIAFMTFIDLFIGAAPCCFIAFITFIAFIGAIFKEVRRASNPLYS